MTTTPKIAMNCYECCCLFLIMEKTIIHTILTVLAIVAIVSAFYMRYTEGAASGSLVGLSIISFFYLIIKYIRPNR